MPLHLTKYTVGPLAENCYLLTDTVSKNAILVDPGEEAPMLLDELKRQGLTLDAIWLTHAHFDHIGAVEGITAFHNVPVLLHPDDKELYANGFKAAAIWNIPFQQPTAPTTDLAAGQVLNFAGVNVQCLFTPGHAPGHISFYLPSEGFVLAGDALFEGSIGRTDLPGGNTELLLESIKTKLLTLPDNTVVYPGHGHKTTIAKEKEYNPFIT